MAFEVDPILRLGEFAINRRTGEGKLGDGVNRASQSLIVTGIKPGPTTDDRFYGMRNGQWVAITPKN